MSSIDKSKPILVTGGSGYIASWIIKYLLDDGYTVHTTVRSKSAKDKYIHLEEIAKKSKGTLKVFEADLLRKGSFLDAMQGTELVIHTASPFFVMGIKDAQKELVDPARMGTINVLESVNIISSVKRVVLTSSVAAIHSDNADIKTTKYGVFTEEYWNTTSSVDENPYNYSKTVAEQEAWKMVNAQSRWDLVTINPSFVFGPSLTKRTDSTSIDTMIKLVNGTFFLGVPELWLGIVDVRDVAKSHILAGFKEDAKGRHILCAASLDLFHITQILREKFGNGYLFPLFRVPELLVWFAAPLIGFTREYVFKNMGIPIKYDNSYTIKNLGLQFTPVKDTITDHFQQLLDDGIVKKS